MLSKCILFSAFWFPVSVLYAKALSSTTKQWNALNTTVGGRLRFADPFSRPCFPLSQSTGKFDPTACSAVQAGYNNNSFRADVFGSFMNTQWEECQTTFQQCELDWQDPTNSAAVTPPKTCQQGSVADVYLEVQSASDVQAAFAFSNNTGIRISIKNTGHDYMGRSSQIGSLALWTRGLKSLSYSPHFVPRGCPATSARPGVTHGAGVLMIEAITFADAHNITLPGGSDSTVGAVGGFLQGGGHSAVSNIYGLAVDRVLEFEVVTPSGKYLFANNCQNTDLFFALRGGGGGTFGVVLSATMQAFPAANFMTAAALFNGFNSTSLAEFMDFVIAHGVQWSKDGWSGIFVVGGAMFLTNTMVNQTAATQYMQPLQAEVERLSGTFGIFPVPSYLALHENFITSHPVPVGRPTIAFARLIPEQVFSSSPTQLRNAILGAATNSSGTLILAVSPFSNTVFKGAGPTSVTPAWRNSIWQVSGANQWLFNTTIEGIKEVYSTNSQVAKSLRDITPGSGAYMNEADVHEPDFTSTFWGNNFERLLAIKQKYDPNHLLDCWRCVNWSGASDPKFRCYL